MEGYQATKEKDGRKQRGQQECEKKQKIEKLTLKVKLFTYENTQKAEKNTRESNRQPQ